MYCTKNTQRNNSAEEMALGICLSRPAKRNNKSCAIGTALLTNYKRDVDKDMTSYLKEQHKIVHYDLSKNDLENVDKKLRAQKQFLDFSFLYDRINQTKIPLSDIFISANHSPNRYYSEIQNRVNTLSTLAKERGLQALFITLTLPSEYHKCKQLRRKGIADKLIPNPKYNGTTPKDGVKVLTKMFAKLRHDRVLKDGLTKENRIYFRVNEPHKDGTPHTHILMFVPVDRVGRVKKAFKRLFDIRANDIQDDIQNSTSYVMKYINKILPLSKQNKLSEKDKYLNTWYSHNKVIRFHSSRTLAPLEIYRLVHSRYSLYALTKLIAQEHFKIYVTLDTAKVMEIIDECGNVVYARGSNYDVVRIGANNKGNYFSNNSQTNDSAIGK